MQQREGSLTENPQEIQVLEIGHFRAADPEYGSRIAEGPCVHIDEFQGGRFSPSDVLAQRKRRRIVAARPSAGCGTRAIAAWPPKRHDGRVGHHL